jgi:1,4-alpha-glucan branching enzyme
LIGDADGAGGRARLIQTAGQGGSDALDMEQFAASLYTSRFDKVVYHESHDDAGNDSGTERTIVCAVNGAPLFGPTRDYAEARARVAFALSLFSAATPLFFMAEEVGAKQPYRYDTFMSHRENLAVERAGDGARLFGFYQDAIRFSRSQPATRSQEIDIIHVLGVNRLIAFTRSAGNDKLLVVASLRNEPFPDGYVIQTDPARLPDGSWREVFNSDAAIYGGANIGNYGADVPVSGGRFQARVPANGVLVFRKR